MTVTRHVYRMYVKAPVDRVWEALIEPEFMRRYFHDTAFDEPPIAGARYRTSMSDGRPAIDGTIEVMEPPHRLVQTWHVLYDAAMSEEPPSRVEWTLTPVGAGLTLVELVHGDLFASPLVWAHVKDGWVYVLDGLKSVVETGEALPPLEVEPVVEAEPVAAWHRQAAVEANNAVWEILGDDARRSVGDLEEMTRRAYAAAYHWDRAAGSGPANAARADWLLSRVWAVRSCAERALDHADRCRALCAENDLVDFDLAYAHEARARALACAGRLDEARDEKARAAAIPISDPEDAAIVVADLAAEPWFGLT